MQIHNHSKKFKLNCGIEPDSTIVSVDIRQTPISFKANYASVSRIFLRNTLATITRRRFAYEATYRKGPENQTTKIDRVAEEKL